MARRAEQSPRLALFLLLVVVGGLGLLDGLTGSYFSFSLLYLGPVAVASWYLGRRAGALVACTSALIHMVLDLSSWPATLSPLILVWNSSVLLGVLLVVSWTLTALQATQQREWERAHTDALTGVPNRRAFFEAAETTLAQSRRNGQPLILAYLDLDNFKQVNDEYGHGAGDELLCTVATLIQEALPAGAVLGRLGGDEFALLLPAAPTLPIEDGLRHLHQQVRQVMHQRQWPVTLSMGVVTCGEPGPDLDLLLAEADRLLYQAKARGKDALEYGHWPAARSDNVAAG